MSVPILKIIEVDQLVELFTLKMGATLARGLNFL
jgi:hypothetical protein